jgi:hypothetical protein
VYEVIKFTQAIVARYGLSKGKYDSYAELDQRLDRTITGLKTEIALKQDEC